VLRQTVTRELIAGLLAIAAGMCWLVWIAANNFNETPRMAELIQVMIAGWNLLLIPAAVVIYERYKSEAMRLFTASGIVSLLFWGYGGATGTITPGSEVVYLLLSGVWWIGIGLRIPGYFGKFTIVLGIFSILDAVLSFFEPMPFYIYVLAAPKLPLSIIWDFWVGFKLAYATDSIKPPSTR
jgi:hypothetical protein